MPSKKGLDGIARSRSAAMEKSKNPGGLSAKSTKGLDGVARKRAAEMEKSKNPGGLKDKGKGLGLKGRSDSAPFKDSPIPKKGRSLRPESDKARGVANSKKGLGSSPFKGKSK